MLILKGCPRCKGDLKVDRDHDGTYLSCLQCGYIKDMEEDNPPIRVRVRSQVKSRTKEPVAR